MVNINKLRGKIVECGLTVEKLASLIGLSKSAFYRKLKGSGENFSIKEANDIAEILNLTAEEVNAIFFAQFVA